MGQQIITLHKIHLFRMCCKMTNSVESPYYYYPQGSAWGAKLISWGLFALRCWGDLGFLPLEGLALTRFAANPALREAAHQLSKGKCVESMYLRKPCRAYVSYTCVESLSL